MNVPSEEVNEWMKYVRILKQNNGECDDNQTKAWWSSQLAYKQAINADNACDVTANGHSGVNRLLQFATVISRLSTTVPTGATTSSQQAQHTLTRACMQVNRSLAGKLDC